MATTYTSGVERLAPLQRVQHRPEIAVVAAARSTPSAEWSQSTKRKITGITPPAFTFSGRCVVCPPIIFRPTMRLAYCTGMRRSLRSTYTMKATTAIISTISADHQYRSQRPPGEVLGLAPTNHWIAARQPDDNAGKNQQRHAVADAALRDLLAQPHDERAARGQRQHGQSG